MKEQHNITGSVIQIFHFDKNTRKIEIIIEGNPSLEPVSPKTIKTLSVSRNQTNSNNKIHVIGTFNASTGDWNFTITRNHLCNFKIVTKKYYQSSLTG